MLIFKSFFNCNTHNFNGVKSKLNFLQKKAIKSCLGIKKGITFATANIGRVLVKFIAIV